MKKMGISRISALFAAGAFVFGGLFSSCSFLDTDDSSSSTNFVPSQEENGGGVRNSFN